MAKLLRSSFFQKNTLRVAERLLGKYLVRRYGTKTIAELVTDVEAYDGPADLASHAARGKTKRNAPMFLLGGHWYLYFTYGMHWMLNIVTGKAEYPAAVLIRGTAEVNGPARVTRAYYITKHFAEKINARTATKKNGLWLEDRGVTIKKSDIKKQPRIGISYAGPIWSKKRYRFRLSSQTLERLKK